jgi:twitching motility protein PilT
MAAIDALLGIVQMKKADGLSLASGEVPALLSGGGKVPLTMPPLAGPMLELFVDELLDAELRATLDRTGVAESTYAPAGGERFALRVRRQGGKTLLSLKKGAPRGAAAGAPPAEASGPLASGAAPPRAPGAELVAPAAPRPPAEATRPSAAGGPIDWALEQAIHRGASDLLVGAGSRAAVRIDGDLVELRGAAPTEADLTAFLDAQLGPERRALLDRQGSVDLAYVHRGDGHRGDGHRGDGDRGDGHGGDGPDAGVRFRVNLFRATGGLAAAFRRIWVTVPSPAELQLPGGIERVVAPRHGLVLFVGPTGSGKSTTVASLLEHVNRTRACHVLTLEDPVEYLFGRGRAIVHQREVGTHVPDFASGLRAALRENPDVVFVGEMRDPETIRMALTAAATGHLVLSTLHSGGAAMAIERIVDAFSEAEQGEVRQRLAAVLRYVVTQQLVPGARGGRIPVVELLVANAAVAAQIRDGRTHLLATQIELGADEGMIPLDRALAALVQAGRITREAAADAATSREALDRLLGARG